jgi:hypothetical protein
MERRCTKVSNEVRYTGTEKIRTYLLSELAQNILRMKFDKGIAEDDRHLVNITGVSPIRIVDGREGDLVLQRRIRELVSSRIFRRGFRDERLAHLASESRHHHVGSVERVDKVGREGGSLSSRIDFGRNGRIGNENSLKRRRNLFAKT